MQSENNVSTTAKNNNGHPVFVNIGKKPDMVKRIGNAIKKRSGCAALSYRYSFAIRLRFCAKKSSISNSAVSTPVLIFSAIGTGYRNTAAAHTKAGHTYDSTSNIFFLVLLMSFSVCSVVSFISLCISLFPIVFFFFIAFVCLYDFLYKRMSDNILAGQVTEGNLIHIF